MVPPDPQANGTSMDLVKDLVDGLNHEEFLVEGYQPSYTDRHVRAVHCYHNLVVIEKGDNVEGSNRTPPPTPSTAATTTLQETS